MELGTAAVASDGQDRIDLMIVEDGGQHNLLAQITSRHLAALTRPHDRGIEDVKFIGECARRCLLGRQLHPVVEKAPESRGRMPHRTAALVANPVLADLKRLCRDHLQLRVVLTQRLGRERVRPLRRRSREQNWSLQMEVAQDFLCDRAQRSSLDRAAEMLLSLVVPAARRVRLVLPRCLAPLVPRDRLQLRASGFLFAFAAN
jgi:hypothetical protein